MRQQDSIDSSEAITREQLECGGKKCLAHIDNNYTVGLLAIAEHSEYATCVSSLILLAFRGKSRAAGLDNRVSWAPLEKVSYLVHTSHVIGSAVKQDILGTLEEVPVP
jgi:hypothetical protein